MKTIKYLFVCLLAIGLISCSGSPEGTLIKGQLANAANLKVYLDKVAINSANEVLANAPIDAEGKFALGFLEELKPGIYQLRVGAQKAILTLEEGDQVVVVDGDLQTFGTYDFTVTGSDASQEMAATMKELSTGSVSIEMIQNKVEEMKNPQSAAFLAFNTLARTGAQGLPVHKVAVERLDATDPMKATYAAFVNGLEAQIARQRSAELIQVGMPAPDIQMESPTGTTYSLSDLKGQVVLLDFWASWCRPCRRENPNVVKVYDKYKDDGFTIFSVSLDGLDSRRTAGMSPDQIEQANVGQKKRWTDAIAQDKLSWPYHVSELTKWESTAGRTYGVRGIPKTFLIDRDGKIAAVGLRGAASIEQALQKVL
ncbi:MAG: TlpA disulfide reductase family protein [Bacteroidota bacterium]